MIYVCRNVKPGRHEGEKKNNLFVSQLGSMESARRAEAIRLRVNMNDASGKDKLSFYLAKRGEEGAPQQSLVDVQPQEYILATMNVLRYTLGGRGVQRRHRCDV